ncbi:amidase [Henriciella sp.]|uniref:amidase n=1 Tax=Henriciella sp. TaxID=1968823 RepID=UPI0026244ADA|nr:amidase [Henriciella sp.]
MGASAGIAALASLSRKAAAQKPDNALEVDMLPDAERVAGVSFTPDERQQMVGAIEERLEAIRALRGVAKPNTLAPAQVFDPRLSGIAYDTGETNAVNVTPPEPGIPPASGDHIAFAPVAQLSHWIRTKQLTCRELTDLYLARIKAHDSKLNAWITLTPERARAEADALDAEIEAGKVRGPLHGIPYGLKDLFDAEGAPVTWGAEPYKDQVAETDSAIVKRLHAAGAVLLGKTSCGALAYGDIWYGAVTRNPFDPREGSSGSSAGSASATAAGLCAFAIGTETLGSLVSPSHRCGTTALRPTFGRVSRAGGMALCWSLDKVGPMVRHVEDIPLIMDALNGFDPADAASIPTGFSYPGREAGKGLTLGFAPAWADAANDAELAAFEKAKALAGKVVEVKLPDLPQEPLFQQLLAEAAATFEDLTLSDRDDMMKWQEDAAWPNSFRAVRFLTAIDLIQIDRLRRLWMQAINEMFDGIDIIIGPNFTSGLLTPTNFTGHPCLVMRAGFQETRPRSLFNAESEEDIATALTPVAVSLWAPLFGETRLLAFGADLERELEVAGKRPDL